MRDNDDKNKRNLIHLHSIDELVSLPASQEGVLVGPNLIVKGEITILAGAPGVGKSMAAMALAISGVTQQCWFGQTVWRPYRTLVLQAENGRLRLHIEAIEYPNADYKDNIMVSLPPEMGLRFEDEDFRGKLASLINIFRPDLIVIDPWYSVSDRDTRESVYQAIRWIRQAIGFGEDVPAVVIVHHTRKPRSGRRSTGAALLNELAGSHALPSVARSVLVIVAESDQPDCDKVVMCCPKNSNGAMVPATIWRRSLGRFEYVADDVVSDTAPADDCLLGKIIEVLGVASMSRSDLVGRLCAGFGLGRTKAYSLIGELVERDLLHVGADKKLSANSGQDSSLQSVSGEEDTRADPGIAHEGGTLGGSDDAGTPDHLGDSDDSIDEEDGQQLLL